jgi:hypothetical protein
MEFLIRLSETFQRLMGYANDYTRWFYKTWDERKLAFQERQEVNVKIYQQNVEWMIEECQNQFASAMNLLMENKDYNLDSYLDCVVIIDKDVSEFLLFPFYHKDVLIHHLEIVWNRLRLT